MAFTQPCREKLMDGFDHEDAQDDTSHPPIARSPDPIPAPGEGIAHMQGVEADAPDPDPSIDPSPPGASHDQPLDKPASEGHHGRTVRRRIILVIVLVIVAAGVIAAAQSLSDARKVDVAGVFMLNDSDSALQNCEGQGGYSDIFPGTSVTIRDEQGKIVGSTSLGRGESFGDYCLYTIAPTQVSSSNFYTVEVSHRGQVTLEKDELGSMSLSLGD